MDACNITAAGLLQQIIGEVVQEPRITSLEQRICNILKKADPQLLNIILGSGCSDIQIWVNNFFIKNNDDLCLIKLFTHAIMNAHNALPINKNEQPDIRMSQDKNHDRLENKSIVPIPNETLKLCFSYYISTDPSWYAVKNFAMTCIQFYNLATEPSSFCELLRYGPVNKLGMSKTFVISKLPMLKEINNVFLDFTDGEHIEEKNTQSLFSCAGYRSFKFKELGNSKKFINAKILRNLTAHSPNLENLALLGAEELTNESIFSLASRCTELSSLKLSNCKNITPEALIALTACTKLHSIELDFLKIEKRNETNLKMGDIYFSQYANHFDKWSSFLTKHRSEFFNLQLGNVSFTDSGFECLVTKFAPTLKKIGLTSSLECKNNALSVFKKCTNLRHFKFLDTNVIIDDCTLKKISKNWSELKSCTILYARKLSHNGIGSLLQQCQKLEKLTLDNYKIDAKTIQSICSYAISLKELRFASSCGMASDFNIFNFIDLLNENKAKLSNLNLLQFSILGEKIPIELLTALAGSFPTFEFVIHSQRFPSQSNLDNFEEKFPDFYLNSYQ